MKFNYALLLISLAQSAPLIEEASDMIAASRGNGLIGSIPILGPLVSGIVGGLPIVGPILGGKASLQQPYYMNRAQSKQQQQNGQGQNAMPGKPKK
jgi:hypothetical protein